MGSCIVPHYNVCVKDDEISRACEILMPDPEDTSGRINFHQMFGALYLTRVYSGIIRKASAFLKKIWRTIPGILF